MKSRKTLLDELLSGTRSPEVILRELSAMGWDSDREHVTLHAHHIAAVLEEFLAGRRSAAAVERWAEAVEGRDDIGLDSSVRDMLTEVVFELANPTLVQPLTPQTARRILVMLSEGPDH